MRIKFSNADKERDKQTKEATKKVRKAYAEGYKEMKGVLDNAMNEINSNYLAGTQTEMIKAKANEVYNNVANEVQDITLESALRSAKVAAQTQVDFLDYVGMPGGEIYYFREPDRIVANLATGKSYEGSKVVRFSREAHEKKDKYGHVTTVNKPWDLSSAIWRQETKVKDDINTIIAQGLARGDTIPEIARNIEKYLLPGSQKPWFWASVNKVVDYNAQRLVRTVIDHAYQETFKEAGKYNPWIGYYVWRSSFVAGRTCQACMDMDGNRYSKDGTGDYPEMPLDHAQGLCYFEYEFTDSLEDIGEQIGNWLISPQGTFPDIDRYEQFLLGELL